MRLFFLFVAFAGLMLSAAAAWAQAGGAATVHGTIKWGGYAQVPTLGARRQKVPTFDEAHPALDDQVGWYSLRLGGDVRQGELRNLVYEPFAPADAKLFNADKLPAGPEPQLTSGTEMKRAVTHLSVRPVRRNPQTGQPERLMSFDYSYAPDSGPVAARSLAITRAHAPHSVLATGEWYKMGVAESGIYKLDKVVLRGLGLNPQSVNPGNLHVYGNATGILPQANAAPRPDDLAENNVLFVGNADNVFDDNEYFLFYSPGAHTWEARGGVFRHRNNLYTDTTYYFVTVNNTAGRRVPTAAAPLATGTTPTITTFNYRDFHEYDLVNLLHSGRNWAGEGFRNGGQQAITFSNIPDLVSNVPVRVTASLVANSATPSAFQLTLNGAALASQTLEARPNYDFGAIATVSTATHQMALASPGTELRVGLTYTSTDPSASGYLDYLEINAQRQLRLSGAQLEFRTFANIGPLALNRYVVANAAGTAAVWDVTNPRRPVARALDAAGSFVAPADTLREYVAFQPGGSFGAPRPFGKVPNQDLHALNTNPNALVDLVIVAYPAFKGPALRLANHRISHDNLRAVVVTTSEVYNEFGSGGQDVTAIRDLMKQLYDRAPAGKQMQLLLFGDASFDYKSDPYNDKAFEPTWWRDRVPFKNDGDFDAFNQNYVPTYESRESLAPFYGGAFGQASYSSDDYFGLLDDNEGEWDELAPGSELLDVGVGRIPVRTPKGERTNTVQAQQVVDKIISYDAVAAYGKWRNRITLVSDDGNGDLFVGQGSELIAKTIQTDYPAYNVHKVYLDLYPQVAVSAGQRSPETNRAIDQSVEQGSLIVNYLGHGGPKGWADEQIVTNASVLALRNPNNLTFFTTGTCDFSTYDNPDFTSAGEQALTDNPTGGAAGLFTTTRVVDAGLNAGLNQAYFNRVLRPVNGQMPSIGTVVMLSKNDYPGPGQPGVINNRNYTLLADPSMTLAYPRQTVALDSVSRRVAGAWVRADTLQALARIRLHGRLLSNGAPNTAFTGRAQVTIYDKPTTVMTLGDKAGGDPASPDAPRPVVVQENVIYGGQAEVVNGQFNLSFVVPKDINYNLGPGKISLYAFDGTHRVDAQGYQLKPVGGAARNVPRDTIPPLISLFMDSESFAFGGLTGQNTTLLAKLSDDSGINTTGAGIGHDITLVLDHDPTKLVVLNDSYVSSIGDFRSGRVNNLFKGLAPGPHSLRLKAWDTYNNSAEKELEFVVARDEKLALDHVLNYPNPFARSTTFFFDHNQAGGEPDNLDVQVQIFTVAGHLVRTLTATVSSAEAHQQSITWNGRDEYDDPLARGVYVYRLSVRSQHQNSTASKYEKLVILN
ncbi:MAG: type IX secretion system sortase PorU [Hymenobacter sp.]